MQPPLHAESRDQKCFRNSKILHFLGVESEIYHLQSLSYSLKYLKSSGDSRIELFLLELSFQSVRLQIKIRIGFWAPNHVVITNDLYLLTCNRKESGFLLFVSQPIFLFRICSFLWEMNHFIKVGGKNRASFIYYWVIEG